MRIALPQAAARTRKRERERERERERMGCERGSRGAAEFPVAGIYREDRARSRGRGGVEG